MSTSTAAGDPMGELVPCTEPVHDFWDVPPYPIQQPKKGIAHIHFHAPKARPTGGSGAHYWPAYMRYR